MCFSLIKKKVLDNKGWIGVSATPIFRSNPKFKLRWLCIPKQHLTPHLSKSSLLCGRRSLDLKITKLPLPANQSYRFYGKTHLFIVALARDFASTLRAEILYRIAHGSWYLNKFFHWTSSCQVCSIDTHSMRQGWMMMMMMRGGKQIEKGQTSDKRWLSDF